MTRKKPKREWVPRIAPPPPTADEVEQKLLDLVEERITREEADDWAMRWVAADDAGIDDDNIWEALGHLGECAMPTTDRPYLYNREDFEAWLADFRGGRPQ